VRKLYDWVIHWGRTTHAQIALFLIAFAESSFFPVPPDVLLIAMVLADDRRWIRFSLICLAGSVLGGMAGYLIGYAFWQATSGFFFQYVFSVETFERVRHLFQQYDFWAVFAAGFTPIPYKVFTIASGVWAIHFPVFVLASVLSRGGRFFLVAGLLRIFGPKIKSFIDRYFNLLTIVFVVLLIGGFVVVKYWLH